MLNTPLLVAKPVLAVAAALFLSFAIPQPAGRLATPRCEDAEEGRRPITKPIVIGPGGEGAYIVTRNITAEEQIIEVIPGTGAVDIDLNGFTLAHTGGDHAIFADQVDMITVRNGRLIYGGLRVVRSRFVIVEDMTITAGEDGGVSLRDIRKFVVRRNVIGQGEPPVEVINTNPYPFGLGGVIEDNVLSGHDGAIKLADVHSVDVARNRINYPGDQPGIEVRGCTSCRFADNLIYDAADDNGMHLDRVTGSKIDGNVVSGCNGSGIILTALSSYNGVVNNVVTGNGRVGLLVQGVGNVIDGNLLSGNASWGLRLDGIDNVYKGNVANNSGGTVADCPGTGPATGDLCDATSGGNLSAQDNFMPDPR